MGIRFEKHGVKLTFETTGSIRTEELPTLNSQPFLTFSFQITHPSLQSTIRAGITSNHIFQDYDIIQARPRNRTFLQGSRLPLLGHSYQKNSHVTQTEIHHEKIRPVMDLRPSPAPQLHSTSEDVSTRRRRRRRWFFRKDVDKDS